MDQGGEVVRSCGFTWQGQGSAPWSLEVCTCLAQVQSVAQRRVLERAAWLPLSTEMLARGWLLGDVGDLVRRVTDLSLGCEAGVACYIESAMRAPRGSHETEADHVKRIKQELLEWLDIYAHERDVSSHATPRHAYPATLRRRSAQPATPPT
jgi:hypothetical protein